MLKFYILLPSGVQRIILTGHRSIKSRNLKSPKFSSVLVCAIVFFYSIGLVSGILVYKKWFLSRDISEIAFDTAQVVRYDGDYKFINPILFCGVSEKIEPVQFQDLAEKVEDEARGAVERDISYSVYYRDLVSGKWFGINENEKYSPASLLKVPLMIANFKNSEDNAGFLKEKFFYGGEVNANDVETFKPNAELQPSSFYSVDDLIYYMIAQSDNNSAILLDMAINADLKDEVYTDLGLSIPSGNATADSISVRSYAHFFRVLYNASYLDHDLSEKALYLLSLARFSSGLASAIPDDVPIAQKFGERKIMYENPVPPDVELHDCGIVYYPEHPYLLCVMTKGGQAFAPLSDLIKSISKVVFEDVDSEYGPYEASVD